MLVLEDDVTRALSTYGSTFGTPATWAATRAAARVRDGYQGDREPLEDPAEVATALGKAPSAPRGDYTWAWMTLETPDVSPPRRPTRRGPGGAYVTDPPRGKYKSMPSGFRITGHADPLNYTLSPTKGAAGKATARDPILGTEHPGGSPEKRGKFAHFPKGFTGDWVSGPLFFEPEPRAPYWTREEARGTLRGKHAHYPHDLDPYPLEIR